MFGDGPRVTSLALQVAEDGGDDVIVEEKRDDAHLTTTAQASEWVDLEDALQHFRPALSGGPQRRPVGCSAVGRGRDLGQSPRIGEDAGLAPAGAPPAGVGAVGTDQPLARVGDVDEELGEELERREDVGAGSGPFALVGLQGDLLLAGVVLQALEADGSPSGVAGELENAAGIVDFDFVDAPSDFGADVNRATAGVCYYFVDNCALHGEYSYRSVKSKYTGVDDATLSFFTARVDFAF